MNSNEARELLELYVWGELTDTEATAVEDWLDDDPAAAKMLATAKGMVSQLDVDLQPPAGADELAAKIIESLDARILPRTQSHRKVSSWMAALAAATIVLLAAATLMFQRPETRSSGSSTVISGNVVVDGARMASLAEGSVISVAGQTPAVIRLSDGSRAELEAGTKAVLHGRTQGQRQLVELLDGGGTFHVEKAHRDFRVETQLGSVIAVGTEFSVRIVPSLSPKKEPGESEMKMHGAMLAVAVLVGAVQVEVGGKTFTLNGGENRVFATEQQSTSAIASASPSPPAGNEVTIKGMVLNNVHTGEKQTSVFVYALDGTPQIKAEFEKIMAECYPDKGLDGDAARKLQDRFTANLKYFIKGPQADELCKNATYNARQPIALTGTLTLEDGKRWINVSKHAYTTFQYPAKMLAADKPLVMPDRPPLVLKISDKLALKCIWVPPGKFFMGEPYYQCPHWHEDPPHMVTLTKGFYMAEHPVTEEMFQAVVGGNSGKEKVANAPANVSCAGMYKFCRAVSQSNGRKVRVPTAAEWEYAARAGTSNPTFREKYTYLDSTGPRLLPVKSKAPNAWGFYDLVSNGWERVSDSSDHLDHQDMVDPQHIPAEDLGTADRTKKHRHFGKGNGAYAISEVEYIESEIAPEKSYPGLIRCRVVVEAEPTTTRAKN